MAGRSKRFSTSTHSEDSANAYQRQQQAEGTARTRAKGKGAIKQVRAAYRQAGVTPPASMRLPTPKRKPK